MMGDGLRVIENDERYVDVGGGSYSIFKLADEIVFRSHTQGIDNNVVILEFKHDIVG